MIDANVLLPGTLRALVLGAATLGAFVPLWSARILEEWARAARKFPEGAEAEARVEIAALRARWPLAEVAEDAEVEAALALPDPADRHVLASAITADAQAILTRNRSDFPTRTLARHGILLREPDEFMLECHQGNSLHPLAEAIQTRSGAQSLRGMLKRVGLPRLGRALEERR